MNVLVTGGAGFLGGHMVAALEAAGHRAFAYDIAKPTPEVLSVAPVLASRLRIGRIDDCNHLMDVCRSDGIEAIVHGAARLGFEPSLADPMGFYQTNIMGQVSVCEVAQKLELCKLIAISSNAAYHAGSGDKLVESDSPFSATRANPAAHYGTSKMAAEAIGIAYADFHDVDFLALRVTAIYGFAMRSPIHIKPMVENAVLGRSTRFKTGGPMKRDYTHVLDCCEAVLRAIEAPRQPPGSQRVLNVAAGRIHTVAEVAGIVQRVLPGADIQVGTELSPLEAANLKMRAPLDVAKAKEVLDWAPRWTLDEGIQEYADRFKRYIRTLS
ncbi:NAD-dependent epimerase/dehydratase family protein [Cupriavidus pinatubonensis]|uniref:NAD-dependent epimerase/dehydratase family protein n=1 Tax=Cupriavidus pinatubonensis TaxID=248026 RepID=UPI001129C66E|nr:NAD(P)-dependent oxidoreductase [Cupriavidus pinatubonensis]TPQ39770.1 hypothetical protein C2U69_11325 [Cupriavidus pinatubonensis]